MLREWAQIAVAASTTGTARRNRERPRAAQRRRDVLRADFPGKADRIHTLAYTRGCPRPATLAVPLTFSSDGANRILVVKRASLLRLLSKSIFRYILRFCNHDRAAPSSAVGVGQELAVLAHEAQLALILHEQPLILQLFLDLCFGLRLGYTSSCPFRIATSRPLPVIPHSFGAVSAANWNLRKLCAPAARPPT